MLETDPGPPANFRHGQATKMTLFQGLTRTLAFLGGLLLAGTPPGTALAAAADEKRLDPAIFQVETPGAGAAADVSYSTIFGLCGDGDACTLRMVLDASGGGFDMRLFRVGQTGGWVADIPGGGAFTSGNVATVGDETVFGTGSDALCRFQDATGFEGILIRKFELVVDGATISPGPATCVLRVED